MTESTQSGDVKQELTGIGGWLVLIAIGQVFGPLRTLINLANSYGEVDPQLFQRFPVAAYGEIVLNVMFIALMIYTTILFFQHSRKFPRLFILEWIAMATLPIIDMLWVAFTLSIYSGKSFSDFLTMDPESGAQIILALLLGTIWITYVLRSRRVANTFVE